MKHGDFSKLASQYHNRPSYSSTVLKILLNHICLGNHDVSIVEIGAGTGKLTRQLLDMGFSCVAVEPNDMMREKGENFTEGLPVKWLNGCGEKTGIEANTFHWCIMASSFHWTDPYKSLPEFSRILKLGGYFTAMWNPRDIEKSQFHQDIENKIYKIAPHIKRKSSGSKQHLMDIERLLVNIGHFKDPFFVEAPHDEVMTKERYLGAWDSVNDIRVQAGEKNWQKIRNMIIESIKDKQNIVVPYRTRSWTVKKTTE